LVIAIIFVMLLKLFGPIPT